MAALVVNNPKLDITFTAGAQDLSAYVVAADLSSSAETLDVGTFANPYYQAVGRPQYGLTIAFLWSEALYDFFAADVDKDVALVFTPDTTAGTTDANLAVTVRYGSLPFGRFEIGQKVEVDITFAIAGDLAWTSTS